MPSYDPTATLDDTLTSSTRAAMGSAVPKLIAVNEDTVQGTKLKLDLDNQGFLTVLTPDDIDDTLSISGAIADAAITGEMINNKASLTDAAYKDMIAQT